MSATVTYTLPTPEDFLWVEDLSASVHSRLCEIEEALRAPFDGDRETEAESVTLEYVGRAFLLGRVLREDARYPTNPVELLEPLHVPTPETPVLREEEVADMLTREEIEKSLAWNLERGNLAAIAVLEGELQWREAWERRID